MANIMDKKGFKYFLAFFIPSLLLAVMTIKPIMTNVLGEEITIKGSAYNTRDLFRGDFIQLDYEISEVTMEHLDEKILKYKNADEYFEGLRGKDLYAVLKKEGKYYVVDKVIMEVPKEGIYLKGRYESPVWEENEKVKEMKESEVKGIRIGYSLDKYFISNKDKNANKNFEKQIVDADLKVYKGYSILKGVK